MKISLNWLRDLVPYAGTVEELADLLTNLGLAVESIERIGASYSGVVTGKVLSASKVEGSDHLTYCMVNVGGEEDLPIVCGAPNVAAGQTVPVALVGATLPGDFQIVERKLRGVLSRGMICSARELGLSEDHSGILVLPEETPIGVPTQEIFGAGDVVFDLEVTFNRPDCLSHLGVAREIAAKTGLPLTIPAAEPVESAEEAAGSVSVEIRDYGKCPRYTARMVKGVKIAASPKWMQDRLKAVGVRPISNIVDVTNYVMMELGHPLHAFDYHLVKDGGIVVRRAESCEKFNTLDGREHKLSSDDLLIADGGKGLALAGVMGGLSSEINDSTQDVLIECAFFDPVGVRMTSRDRGIQTESSRRFERGVDIEMTRYAAARAAALIQQLSGGVVLRGDVDARTTPPQRQAIRLRPFRVNAILGAVIPVEVMTASLTALGCIIEPAGENYDVTPPSWRGDLEREIDLIEEIIRLHGYEKVESASCSSVSLEIDPARENERRAISKIKYALVEQGLSEAISWSLAPLADVKRYSDIDEPLRVLNPLSEDLAALRTSLAQSLLRAVERNLNVGVPNVRLFEFGKRFLMKDGEIVEQNRLGIALTGSVRPDSWLEKSRLLTVHDVQGMALALLESLKLDKSPAITYDIPATLASGGVIRLGENPHPLGHFGCIAPEIASSFGIDSPVWYIEFDGDRLIGEEVGISRYRSLARFPAAIRDLAFLVPADLPAGSLQEHLVGASGLILESIDLFDFYRGKGVPEGKKSLGFRLTFRRQERTLSDAEVDAVIGVLIGKAAEIGAELRR